jgi:hypothetical protein
MQSTFPAFPPHVVQIEKVLGCVPHADFRGWTGSLGALPKSRGLSVRHCLTRFRRSARLRSYSCRRQPVRIDSGQVAIQRGDSG